MKRLNVQAGTSHKKKQTSTPQITAGTVEKHDKGEPQRLKISAREKQIDHQNRDQQSDSQVGQRSAS